MYSSLQNNGKTIEKRETSNQVINVFKNTSWKPFNYISSIQLSNGVSDENYLYALINTLRSLEFSIPKLIDGFQSGFYIGTTANIHSILEKTTLEFNEQNVTNYDLSNVTIQIHLNKIFLARDRINKVPLTSFFVLQEPDIIKIYANSSIMDTSTFKEISSHCNLNSQAMLEIVPSSHLLFIISV